MEIPKIFKDEIWDYCRLNNISNIDEFTLKLLKQGFTIEKFGATPTTMKEKIIERIVEVPVERIVEKRVEVSMLDTELSENLKKYISLYDESQLALKKAIDDMMLTKKQLEEEKIKNKKDLYGE